ncbi:hypothetical protein BKK51_05605 [Rodentibacter trehalosifermentans]|uniref:Uncharacterized protein n=1 Tax=Rodentibacter trehalosifermentans TaxID=1908263 RepID=A0A1V3J0K6_9PAST|nr:hypothetical protein [Rodentibacter trehalosifermentans]OOF45661.1 hypothetical protein BKK51_05605 [Rodentibacter trehalosifermentans]OOF48423.1 hypothetical protein BKK52_05950 [Rodentibacter trehalosifermentans]
MTAFSVEERLSKLEAQMQKGIERQNLLSELLSLQGELQQVILYHLKTREAMSGVDSFSPFLAQWHARYDQILSELPPEDANGREYVRSLQRLLEFQK